jgi:hypothetical protein
MDGGWLVGKSGTMQCPIEPIATAIPSKNAACSIATMRRWREANNKESRFGVAETWNRLAPVVPITVAFHLLQGDALTMFY